MPPVIDNVVRLKPCLYRFKDTPEGARKSIGLIAQEVEQLFPESVDEKEGIMAINYDAFAVIAIQAIKEQQVEMKEQQKTVPDLQQRIERLESML